MAALGEKLRPGGRGRARTLGRGTRTYKGPEAEMILAGLGNSRKASGYSRVREGG